MNIDIIILLFVIIGIILQISSLTTKEYFDNNKMTDLIDNGWVILNIIVIFIAKCPLFPIIIFTQLLLNLFFWNNLKDKNIQTFIWILDTFIAISILIITAYYNINFENIL